MRKSRRNPAELDLTTTCTNCGYKIQPAEILRTGWQLIRCPKCWQEFEPEQKGDGQSTS